MARTNQKPNANVQTIWSGLAPLPAINPSVPSTCLLELAILKSMSRVATTENTAAVILVSPLRPVLAIVNPIGNVLLLTWCHVTRQVWKRLVALVTAPSMAIPVLLTMGVAMLAVMRKHTRASATLLVSMKAAE